MARNRPLKSVSNAAASAADFPAADIISSVGGCIVEEQIGLIMRGLHLLVGPDCAGLTHTMFQKSGVNLAVEIELEEPSFTELSNMAKMNGEQD